MMCRDAFMFVRTRAVLQSYMCALVSVALICMVVIGFSPSEVEVGFFNLSHCVVIACCLIRVVNDTPPTRGPGDR